MNNYSRKYPKFSLCGLKCGLCPRFQSEGKSKCPGCGGKNFSKKHPTCRVINCNLKKDHVDFCFQCSYYPCDKYLIDHKVDSFISYQNVIKDFNECSNIGIEKYMLIIDKKIKLLNFFLKNYNNGKLKSFYCLAINLLNLEDIEKIVTMIKDKIEFIETDKNKKIKMIVNLFEITAQEKGIILKLINNKV